MAEDTGARTTGKDFIRAIVERHLDDGTYGGRVVTRFPPEPNGYLHIGHAKSICLNFGIAEEYGGRCHLRYDDTNPLTEDERFARSMREDIRWLGFDWGEHLYHASDYFEKLYGFAVTLIEKGLAYVDSQTEEEIRQNRGSVVEPGMDSPFRDRSVEENLDLFERMRAGEFEDGSQVLRAKIDMAHQNMVMRDPILYRILHADHYRTGDAWRIYPLYDYAHCLEDAIEDITHSFCTLEFENNREIYDWILDHVGFEEPRTHQYEFARLNLDYTVLSKRKLIRLVEGGHVEGWDDPRMPTIAGIRRRGVPPEAVRRLCDMVGITKANSRVDIGKFEYAVREELNPVAPRVLAVLRPLKVVLTNVPEGETEWVDGAYFPKDVGKEGGRRIPLDREIVVERSDFSLDPPDGWKRLAPGRSVRLRHGPVITLDAALDAGGGAATNEDEVAVLHCSVIEGSVGQRPEGVKISGVIHWVSAANGVRCAVRMVDRLFTAPDPDDVEEGQDFTVHLNPDSLDVLDEVLVEPSVLGDPGDTRYQFERVGYFWRDPELSSERAPVFNRIVSLRDSWTRRAKADVDEVEEKRSAVVRPEESKSPIVPIDRISDERRAARDSDPELLARFNRYQSEVGLSLDEADILTGSRETSDFFEAALATDEASPVAVAAWIVNEVLREAKGRPIGELPFDAASLARLVEMVERGQVTRTVAKEVFALMVSEGSDPVQIVAERGLEKVSDESALGTLIDGVIEAHPKEVASYRAGKANLLGFFIGQVMKSSAGSADPQVTRRLLTSKLGGVQSEDSP